MVAVIGPGAIGIKEIIKNLSGGTIYFPSSSATIVVLPGTTLSKALTPVVIAEEFILYMSSIGEVGVGQIAVLVVVTNGDSRQVDGGIESMKISAIKGISEKLVMVKIFTNKSTLEFGGLNNAP